jgi:hypothetical protein
MEGADTNTQTLRNEGLLAGELPADYERWINGLSPQTIEELRSLKKILKDEHGIEAVPIRVKDKGLLPIFAVTKSMPVL